MVSRRPTFTVSGPGVDRNGFESGPVALSAAITFAERGPFESTFYARDGAGEIFGRVERDVAGNLAIFRIGGDR